jgi:hypothetical protein
MIFILFEVQLCVVDVSHNLLEINPFSAPRVVATILGTGGLRTRTPGVTIFLFMFFPIGMDSLSCYVAFGGGTI